MWGITYSNPLLLYTMSEECKGGEVQGGGLHTAGHSYFILCQRGVRVGKYRVGDYIQQSPPTVYYVRGVYRWRGAVWGITYSRPLLLYTMSEGCKGGEVEGGGLHTAGPSYYILCQRGVRMGRYRVGDYIEQAPLTVYYVRGV